MIGSPVPCASIPCSLHLTLPGLQEQASAYRNRVAPYPLEVLKLLQEALQQRAEAAQGS